MFALAQSSTTARASEDRRITKTEKAESEAQRDKPKGTLESESDEEEGGFY